MKVKLRTGRVGDNLSQKEGDVITVDAAEGQRMIDRGQAEPVEEAESPKTQTKKAG